MMTQGFMRWPTAAPDGGPLRIYEVGYRGRAVEIIAGAVLDVHGCLIDCRLFAPFNRPYNPKLFRAHLQDRYAHVRALGNRNYKTGGPVAILDAERGVHAALAAVSASAASAIVLMCACERFDECHRRVVADLIRAAVPGAGPAKPLLGA